MGCPSVESIQVQATPNNRFRRRPPT
jgi:hypothetical protein